jgi:type IV secretory pathway VirB10-like protein
MSGEVSYFSRFLAKFVEIIGAGLASAVCAYLFAHFGGLLPSSPAPASAPALTAVQVGPTGELAKNLRAQPTPPAAAAAVNAQRPAPQQDTDAPVAQPALKAVKDVKTLPPRKHNKTDKSVAEKKPPGQKSAEALARAALANVDANWPAPADAPSAGPPLEIATRPPPPPADRDNGVFSALKRIPDLLIPDPPAATGEVPRPPMPVGTPSPE